MLRHSDIDDTELKAKIKQGVICYGGNRKLKIYGQLHCFSGKRILRANRVFFYSKRQAQVAGYRPCGHCMKSEYKLWIYSTNN